MRGLYAIVDVDTLLERGLDVLTFAERILAARPAALQLRAKRATPRDALSLLRRLREPCRAAGVPLYANDRPDLALLGGADGLHVGQTDLPLRELRRFFAAATNGGAPLRIGVSTHDDVELAQALAERPDYVAFGPVFTTRSKAAPDPEVGLEGLARAGRAARAAGIPLVAIGGIDAERAPSCARHAEACAVILALLPPDGDLGSVTARARALHHALGADA